jgi:electron transfer flavoprotein beta subunit
LRPEQALGGGTGGLEIEGRALEWEASPGDLVACEAAVRLRESRGGSVSVYTVGPAGSERALRAGLELGAERATRIDWDPGVLLQDSGLVGRLLGAALEATGPFDVVLFGARSGDSGSGVVPAVVAGCLGQPLVAGVTHLAVTSEFELEATTSVGGGRQRIVTVRTPTVIAAEPYLAEPRYPSMAARARARNAPVEVLGPAKLMPGSEGGPPASAGGRGSAETGPGVRLAQLRPGGPSVRPLVAPPPGLTAHERLAFILAGGTRRAASTGRLLEGSSEEVISAIVEFLRAKGVA